MKVCSQCRLSFDDSATNCGKCGAPLTFVNMQAPVAAPTTDHTADFTAKDISENKVLAMIPYLMGWIGIIITLLAAGTSPYAGFHVRQALKIQVCVTLGTLLSTIACIIFIGLLALPVISILSLVINIICFISVCKGEAKEPPIVSSFKFLK